MEDGTNVPRDAVLRMFPNVKFYDAPPTTPWLMKELWSDYFISLREPDHFDETLGAHIIPVTIDAATHELQRAYGSGALAGDERSCSFPRSTWIRQALEAFVRAKLAVPGGSSGEYKIIYRPIRGDVLRRFVKLTEGLSEEPRPGQMDLLDDLQENDPE